jgi:hypothetical protein
MMSVAEGSEYLEAGFLKHHYVPLGQGWECSVDKYIF